MKLTTTNLRLPTPRRWFELQPPIAATICIFCLLAIAAIVGRVRSAPSAAVVPTPALPAAIIIIASPLPHVPPTAVPPAAQVAALQPAGNVTQRAIGVFGAPDTASYIGSVEAGRTFSPVARYGAEWTQVDMDGSGRVFVRTSDLYGVPEGLVDLEPAPAPIVIDRPVYLAGQPAAVAPVEQAVSTPEPYQATGAPPACDERCQNIQGHYANDRAP